MDTKLIRIEKQKLEFEIELPVCRNNECVISKMYKLMLKFKTEEEVRK